MKNIRYLVQDSPKKKARECAIFFEHDGLRLRLDFEIDLDTVDYEDFVVDRMIEQLEEDFADTEHLEQIRERQEMGISPGYEIIDRYLDHGYTELPAEEFKRRVKEKFGD